MKWKKCRCGPFYGYDEMFEMNNLKLYPIGFRGMVDPKRIEAFLIQARMDSDCLPLCEADIKQAAPNTEVMSASLNIWEAVHVRDWIVDICLTSGITYRVEGVGAYATLFAINLADCTGTHAQLLSRALDDLGFDEKEHEFLFEREMHNYDEHPDGACHCSPYGCVLVSPGVCECDCDCHSDGPSGPINPLTETGPEECPETLKEPVQ